MNTGGPAFPHHETTSTGEPFHDHLGMTLLDWMAGQALAGLMASGRWDTNYKACSVAYDQAGHMLAEKARREADHSGDANKMVQQQTTSDNERWARFQDGIRIAFSPTGGWLAEIREGSMGYGDTIADAICNLRARWEERNAAPQSATFAKAKGIA